MNEKITVVRFGTKRGDFCSMEIENTLEAFQKMVGGYIEPVCLPGLREENIIIIANEEGLLKGLDHNRNAEPFFLVGDLVFTAFSENDCGGEDFQSLTESQIDRIAEFFHLNNE